MKTARKVLVIPAAVVAVSMFGSTAVAATPAAGSFQATTMQAAPTVGTQGIIMRDGGVCDPIRHMGC